MAASFGINALVRAAARRAFGGLSTQQSLDMNAGGDFIVTQGQPEHTELARLGVRWNINTPVANAFAPVAAAPTTLANIVLYNNNTAASKICLVIDSVYVYEQTSLAALSGFTLLGQISNLAVAAPSNNTAVLVNGSTGAIYAGGATKAIANTAFAIADKWEALGISVGAPAAGIGSGAYAEVKGRYIVKPGAAFLANVIASTAAGTLIQGIGFYEYYVDCV